MIHKVFIISYTITSITIILIIIAWSLIKYNTSLKLIINKLLMYNIIYCIIII